MWGKSTAKPLLLHENIKRTKILEHSACFQEGPELNNPACRLSRIFYAITFRSLSLVFLLNFAYNIDNYTFVNYRFSSYNYYIMTTCFKAVYLEGLDF